MRRHGILLGVAVGVLILPQLSRAWGPGGHMMVARIAYSRLNKNAKAEVDRLIKLSIPPVNQTRFSLNFVDSSHWADDVRRSEEFSAPEFAERHYADFPFSPDGTPLPPLPAEENVLSALKKYVAVLKDDTAADDDKAMALRFIVHFVGDVHQPLHCSTRVTADLPNGDRGGNDFLVKAVDKNGRTRQVKLHAYWDGGLATFPSGVGFKPPAQSAVTAMAAAIQKKFPAAKAGWKKGGAMGFDSWAKESSALAQAVVYKGITPKTAVSASYVQTRVPVAQKRVAWAGYRLAALLNAVWPEN